MLRRDEENCVSGTNAASKRRPFDRRIFFGVLIINRQLSNLDNTEFSPSGANSAARWPPLIE